MMRVVLVCAALLAPISAATARNEAPDLAPDLAPGATPDSTNSSTPGAATEQFSDSTPDPASDLAPDPVPDLAPPMVVTSDTDAYCESLSRQIDRYGEAVPKPVALLSEQGRRLCAVGQVRGGINRLRRALLALHEPDDPEGDADGEEAR